MAKSVIFISKSLYFTTYHKGDIDFLYDVNSYFISRRLPTGMAHAKEVMSAKTYSQEVSIFPFIRKVIYWDLTKGYY